MIRTSGSLLLLACSLALGAWSSLSAQSTWRVDSLMSTWPVMTRMEEVRNQLGRGVIRTMDTKDLTARLIRASGTLPVISDTAVERYIHLYGEPKREQFRALLGMAQAYFPMIEEELAKQGLPPELKYLPMAMSAMNAQAASPTGEAGLWMLTWPVAVRYGLVVTAAVDERNDVRKSTVAAARYLKDLHVRYRDWETAVMAFACGSANVTRAKQRAAPGADHTALYAHMSDSHRDVLPMLMAFIYLTTEADDQGIEPIAMRPWEAVDSVSDARAMRFDALAAVLGTPLRHLRSINPTLIASKIPAGRSFCVPAGERARFAQLVDSVQRLDQSLIAARATLVPVAPEETTTMVVEKTIRYRIRSGDNLGEIAQRHHVSVSQLKKWNQLRSDRIAAGKYLTIHVKTRQKVKAPVEADDALPEGEGPTNRAQPETDAVNAKNTLAAGPLPDLTYTVQSGDSLYRIAKRYPGLTVQRIMEVNGIGTAIRPGQKLRIPHPSMRPVGVLLFLLAVLCGLGVLGSLMPAEGIRIGEAFTLDLPSPREMLFPQEEEKVDISDILAVTTDSAAVRSDSLALAAADIDPADTLPFVFDESKLPPLQERIALHYPNGDKSVLHPLFAALESAGGGHRPIRIMHYGDSQLEGDRITAYLRNKLQTQFGGSGPGLIAVADIVPSFSVDRTISDNWKRYSAMGRKDRTQHHDRFGALSAFSRFTAILPDTAVVDTVLHTATVTLSGAARAYGKARAFTSCKLYYGWHRAPITLTLEQDGAVISTEVVDPADKLLVKEWRFTTAPKKITITFTGADSPDVFGIALDGGPGLGVDNIAARGAAGYEFRRADQQLLRSMYDDLDAKLLILQYGGNVLPNLKSAEEAAQYGRFFGAQIARFKKLIPGVSIIVIGPSDMSIKEGDAYVTRPFLEDVRDALKTNTLAQGGVFWDLYDAMGGRNSMVSWVTADPPLAATDYTHFSPSGAKKVGELFYTALINDFAAYHRAKE